MEVTKYRMADRARRRRFKQYVNATDPTDLTSELAVARLLLADALEQRQTALGNMLLGTLAKLTHSQVATRRLTGELMPREAAYRLVEEMCNIVAKAIENKFDGWEDTINQIADSLVTKVKEPPREETHE